MFSYVVQTASYDLAASASFNSSDSFNRGSAPRAGGFCPHIYQIFHEFFIPCILDVCQHFQRFLVGLLNPS